MLVEARVDAVANGERPDGDDEEQNEERCHAHSVPDLLYQDKSSYSSILLWNLIVGSASSPPSRRSRGGRPRGPFGRAAVALGYTQSAISQQIQTSESPWERLLERPGGPRAVSLTEAGTLLLRHAEVIVARLHAAQADGRLAAGPRRQARIGTFRASAHASSPS